MVPFDDPTAFGADILRTLDRRESFDPAVLRASVERRFGADFVAERLHVAYREALARRSPPSAEADPTLAGPPIGLAPAEERASSDARIVDPVPADAPGPGALRPIVVA